MRFELLHEDCVPFRGDPTNAGWDLRARSEGDLHPHDRVVIPLGIKIELPAGTVGIIKPRSGLAKNFGLDILAGVIDSGFRGELCAMIINHGDDLWSWSRGDRVAQLLVLDYVQILTLTEVDSLSESDRGEAGFGSSGVA